MDHYKFQNAEYVFFSFQNGQITRERILVLFFFCSDVAILAIRQKATALVAQLTQWSLEFIRNQVNTGAYGFWRLEAKWRTLGLHRV